MSRVQVASALALSAGRRDGTGASCEPEAIAGRSCTPALAANRSGFGRATDGALTSSVTSEGLAASNPYRVPAGSVRIRGDQPPAQGTETGVGAPVVGPARFEPMPCSPCPSLPVVSQPCCCASVCDGSMCSQCLVAPGLIRDQRRPLGFLMQSLARMVWSVNRCAVGDLWCGGTTLAGARTLAGGERQRGNRGQRWEVGGWAFVGFCEKPGVLGLTFEPLVTAWDSTGEGGEEAQRLKIGGTREGGCGRLGGCRVFTHRRGCRLAGFLALNPRGREDVTGQPGERKTRHGG